MKYYSKAPVPQALWRRHDRNVGYRTGMTMAIAGRQSRSRAAAFSRNRHTLQPRSRHMLNQRRWWRCVWRLPLGHGPAISLSEMLMFLFPDGLLADPRTGCLIALPYWQAPRRGSAGACGLCAGILIRKRPFSAGRPPDARRAKRKTQLTLIKDRLVRVTPSQADLGSRFGAF